MKTWWENNGEPNAEGHYHAVIDLEDGSVAQNFYGSSHKDVADKLLVAQANASAKISEQKKQLRGAPVQATTSPDFKPRVLSADDRFRIANEVQDPAKAPEAIAAVFEAAVGAPLETIRRVVSEDAQQREAERYVAEAEAFAEETPDYVKCQHNGVLIANFCKMNGWAYTKGNYAIAWEELKEAGLVRVKQAETENGQGAQEPATSQENGGLPVNPSTTTRPRGMTSTGIRSSETSGPITSVRTAAPKYTIAQIEAMSQVDYLDKLKNEAGFAKLVDDLYAVRSTRRN